MRLYADLRGRRLSGRFGAIPLGERGARVVLFHRSHFSLGRSRSGVLFTHRDNGKPTGYWSALLRSIVSEPRHLAERRIREPHRASTTERGPRQRELYIRGQRPRTLSGPVAISFNGRENPNREGPGLRQTRDASGTSGRDSIVDAGRGGWRRALVLGSFPTV